MNVNILSYMNKVDTEIEVHDAQEYLNLLKLNQTIQQNKWRKKNKNDRRLK